MVEFTIYAVATLNLVTFVAFGIDKWKAAKQRWRIPEATLLLLTWATGLAGGWLGMSVFRHKTQKTSFKVKMFLVSLVNLLWLVLWLHLRTWE